MYVCRTTFLRLLTAQLHPISQIHLMYHSLPTSHTCRTTVCRREVERTNEPGMQWATTSPTHTSTWYDGTVLLYTVMRATLFPAT